MAKSKRKVGGSVVNGKEEKIEEEEGVTVDRTKEKETTGNKALTLLSIIIAIVAIGYHNRENLNNIQTESSMYLNSTYANEWIYENVLPYYERGMKALNGSTTDENPYFSGNQDRVGLRMKDLGAKAKHPIFFIPGFVTSGLEFWESEPCAKKFFRQRIWGGMNMANAFFSDKECWRRHLSLDPYTGLDPSGIKIRAAQGYEAADYFAGNYWVFAKLIENLADVGYNPNNMFMISYDWRMTFSLLENRDARLSHMKSQIEVMVKHSGEKVVLASHSMGCALTLFFLKWVEMPVGVGGGGGGGTWVDEHIHAHANLAGVTLGVPKAFAALLSGEMKDTTLFGGHLDSLVENFFGKKARRDMFSSWGSLWALAPKGGDAIWGIGADFPANATYAKDSNVAPLLKLTNAESFVGHLNNDELLLEESNVNELAKKWIATVDVTPADAMEFLKTYGAGLGENSMSAKMHSFAEPSEDGLDSVDHWHDPSVTPLPNAPNMKHYCMYGVDIPTERAYYYKVQSLKEEAVLSNETFSQPTGAKLSDPPFIMDMSQTDKDSNVESGVVFADGDGTVSLLSLGYLCASGWRDNKWLNPSGLKTVVREYQNKESFQVNDPGRGGPHSGAHCDVLGNVDLLEDLIKVVTGYEEEKLEDKVVSDILQISSRLEEHPLGGVKRSRSFV